MKIIKTATLMMLPLVLGLVCVRAGRAQTTPAGQKVVTGMIEALGGQAFLDVREIQVQGSFYSFRRNELQGYDVYVDYVKFPDRERTEFGATREKRIQINRGAEGWMISGRDGKDIKPQSERETEEFLRNMKTSYDYFTRFVMSAPQTTLLSTGTEIIDFKRTDVIELRDASKNLIRFLVDRDTRLPVRMQVRRADESAMYEEAYANWHKFQGVMTPLFVTRFTDGVKTMEIRADKVSYNPGFPESFFSPPATR